MAPPTEEEYYASRSQFVTVHARDNFSLVFHPVMIKGFVNKFSTLDVATAKVHIHGPTPILSDIIDVSQVPTLHRRPPPAPTPTPTTPAPCVSPKMALLRDYKGRLLKHYIKKEDREAKWQGEKEERKAAGLSKKRKVEEDDAGVAVQEVGQKRKKKKNKKKKAKVNSISDDVVTGKGKGKELDEEDVEMGDPDVSDAISVDEDGQENLIDEESIAWKRKRRAEKQRTRAAARKSGARPPTTPPSASGSSTQASSSSSTPPSV
ncbi:hypothetical protein JAAARDRAFT_199108 [Jaapia argillacea MUCL 33604]|uniref:Uncharacterized protein n=1 Tax=Jaapia argillacea MUCL 33604 TaxID=933084 RepID=A0A067P9P5_9AGAM|nr:hypothetical protein JAAARDRAFT_199108 [Jaapia argillacea MUCL 33604]